MKLINFEIDNITSDKYYITRTIKLQGSEYTQEIFNKRIDELVDKIILFYNLTKLMIYNLNCITIDHLIKICKITSLKKIDIINCSIKEIPPNIQQLINLTSFSLVNHNKEQTIIPLELFTLKLSNLELDNVFYGTDNIKLPNIMTYDKFYINKQSIFIDGNYALVNDLCDIPSNIEHLNIISSLFNESICDNLPCILLELRLVNFWGTTGISCFKLDNLPPILNTLTICNCKYKKYFNDVIENGKIPFGTKVIFEQH